MTIIAKLTAALKRVEVVIFASPRATLAVVFLVTGFLLFQIPSVHMASDFADLLPQEHRYIQLHNEIREVFGGANNIVLAVEVDSGDIFTQETLGRIHRVTQRIDQLPGINHNMVTSITHRNTRKVWLDQTGAMKSAPYYDPLQTAYSSDRLTGIKNDAVADPRVYGVLISPDLRAGLIRGTLNEGELDYQEVFDELQKIRADESASGTTIYATGQPVLIGWVTSYVGEVIQIFAFTVLIMLGLLLVYFRRLYGILLPILGIVLTTIWGLGVLSLLGYNLDPLMLVVPFLISARAMSHGIQMVERYYYELSRSGNKQTAARGAFENLFRPGSLGVISDAIGLLLISLGSVPINDKMAVYASFWAISVIFTVLVSVPCMLEILPQPRSLEIKHGILRSLMPLLSRAVGSRKGALAILTGAGVLAVAGLYLSAKVQIGEAEPGSPLLYPDHDFNVSSKAINQSFPGSEELFVIAETKGKGGLKEPAVLRALSDFQNHMLMDPELGGAKGLPNLISRVNRITHNDDPRWAVIPESTLHTGGLMFMYMMSSPVPGALAEFLDSDERIANMVFYYKDHQGETIRRAIHMVNQWVEQQGDRLKDLEIRLAGGTIGVTAAINESAYHTNIVVIPAVFLLIFAFVAAFYWSLHAGALMVGAMTFATILTYAYMGVSGIGINVNTVPIIAVGVGVGIDYSIYIMDRIRCEMRQCGDLQKAVRHAICTTGVAVGFTATTLIGGVIMWVFLSDLRFQADAALLLIVMLILNALAAWFLIPSWIRIFRPGFIVHRARRSPPEAAVTIAEPVRVERMQFASTEIQGEPLYQEKR